MAILDGPVGDLMNAHGITRYDATTFISHGIIKDAQTGLHRGEAANRSGSEAVARDATGSSTFKVQFLNNDYTPMAFVVHVLEEMFELEHDDAVRVMLQIHHEGAAACGSFSREEAEARAAQIMDLARQHQHPLRCVLV